MVSMIDAETLEAPPLGILLLDTRFPRIPGDIGNPRSYAFPVRMRTVNGATVRRVVVEGDPLLLDSFLQTAKELEAEGVCAITTSCGFLAPFQKTLARELNIPVFLSALIQIPVVFSMTQKRIGLITADGQSLSRRHLAGAGVPEEIPLAIRGLHDKPAFAKSILEDTETLDHVRIRGEVVEAAAELLEAYPNIGSFVFECHNLAPYAAAVSEATRKPVFDVIAFANWIYAGIRKRAFPDP